jgi:hypothetical protein
LALQPFTSASTVSMALCCKHQSHEQKWLIDQSYNHINMLHYLLLEDRLGQTTISCIDGIMYYKMPETEDRMSCQR